MNTIITPGDFTIFSAPNFTRSMRLLAPECEGANDIEKIGRIHTCATDAVEHNPKVRIAQAALPR
jgi:hypothetical protein